MIKTESACVGCSSIFGGCRGSACPNYSVTVFECDCCGEEVEELYKYDGQEYCEECLLDQFEKVTDDDLPDDYDYWEQTDLWDKNDFPDDEDWK